MKPYGLFKAYLKTHSISSWKLITNPRQHMSTFFLLECEKSHKTHQQTSRWHQRLIYSNSSLLLWKWSGCLVTYLRSSHPAPQQQNLSRSQKFCSMGIDFWSTLRVGFQIARKISIVSSFSSAPSIRLEHLFSCSGVEGIRWA